MKSKTTLNLLTDSFIIEIKNQVLLFFAFTNKKILPSTFLFLFTSVLLLNSSIIYSQSSSCKAILQADKNRFTKSAPPEGVSYLLHISNTGTANSVYSLSVININSSCSNNDGTSTSNNVNLNVTFTDTNSIPINQIALNPGETITFFVQVKVPIGTAVSKWNCSEIKATAAECPSYNVSTVLHTMVSDPSSE